MSNKPDWFNRASFNEVVLFTSGEPGGHTDQPAADELWQLRKRVRDWETWARNTCIEFRLPWALHEEGLQEAIVRGLRDARDESGEGKA